MIALRQLRRLAGFTALSSGLTLVPFPAAAQQEDFEQIVIIMRACADIEDVGARVTCYDNTVRPPGAPTRPESLRQTTVPAAPAATGFGSEMVAPTREERASRPDDDEGVTASVAAISSLEPGIYLVTLADGAQWRFVDAATGAWYPPRAGDRIELERGSLGSVFLTYDGQRRLRVRRVR